jgi:hypothetical protein
VKRLITGFQPYRRTNCSTDERKKEDPFIIVLKVSFHQFTLFIIKVTKLPMP